MSDIFLNYDDVRHLVKFLGKHRARGDDSLSRIQLVAAGLKTNVGLLHNGLQAINSDSLSGINMTQDHYSDLCVAIRSNDLMSMRHTDRLEVVARSLGWRADSLMHHLKTTTGEMGSNPSLRYDIDFVGDFVKMVGTEHSDQWRSMLFGGPGLFVVTGQPGDGVSRSWIASVLLVDADAATTGEGIITGQRKVDGQPVYGVSARTRESLRNCLDLASTSTVIASHGGSSIDETHGRLVEWADMDGISLSCLKGMLHQAFNNRYSGLPVEIKVDIRDFTGR
jgi:hypothetical protein